MSKSKHTIALEEIARHPEKIGVSGVVDWRQVEFPFYNNEGRMLGEVDVVLHTTEGGLYYVEYKCTDSPKARLKASEQLVIAKQGMREQHDFHANRLVYVHNDLVPEFYIKGEFYKIEIPNTKQMDLEDKIVRLMQDSGGD